MEQIKAMLEAMEKNTAFGEEMQALMESGDIAGIIGLAAEKGFAFTEADWQAYIDWGRSVTASPVSKELAPEELENVVGGRNGSGQISDPYHSGCWFHAASEPVFRDGAMRRRCNQYRCKVMRLGGEKDSTFVWYICGCWGSHKCVAAWHEIPGNGHDCG